MWENSEQYIISSKFASATSIGEIIYSSWNIFRTSKFPRLLGMTLFFNDHLFQNLPIIWPFVE